MTASKTINVFAHLAHGYGAEKWERGWREGRIAGINERLPYGYYRAADDGCVVHYSVDRDENAFDRLLRLSVRAVLGFDLIHAWRNIDAIREADVVWTHTESQHLALMFLRRLKLLERTPKVIAQTIWLFDIWPSLSSLRRYFYSKLIADADIVTVHSRDNLALARRMFPKTRVEQVLFGINAEDKVPPRVTPRHRPLRIMSLGNDIHRDWRVLIDAVAGRNDWTLRIGSGRLEAKAVAGMDNIDLERPVSNSEILALYGWADLVIVPIKPNLHASGLTVLQECALRGLPIICTDVGGLRDYFADTDVLYVAPGDAAELRQAVEKLADDDELRRTLAANANRRMGADGLSSAAYVQRHVEISRQLMAQSPKGDSASCGIPAFE